MAYAVDLSAIAEVWATMHVDSQLCMSLFHYQYDSGSGITDGKAAMVDLLNKLRAAGRLKDKYIACISDQVQDIDWHGQWILPTRYRVVELAVASDGGQAAANPLPSAVSVALTKRGELANRSNIGTLHMPAVPESFETASLVNALGFVAYDALGVEMKAPVVLTTGQLMNPVILSRTNHILSPTIDTVFTQATIRVNRRRTVGLGA